MVLALRLLPGSNPGECTAGTAESLEAARAAFERAWNVFLSRRTEAEFEACRRSVRRPRGR
jgi:hypothetical protein